MLASQPPGEVISDMQVMGGATVWPSGLSQNIYIECFYCFNFVMYHLELTPESYYLRS